MELDGGDSATSPEDVVAVVAHFGVGSSPVFLAQMQPQLTLVPKMQAAGVTVVWLLPGVDANVAFEGL